MYISRIVRWTTPMAALLVLMVTVPAAVAQAPVDPSGAVRVEGTVISLVAGPGMGGSVLTLEDPSLGRVQVALGPFWFLQDAGLVLQEGAAVRGTLHPCAACSVPWVAATLEDPVTGSTVTLRDASGLPQWRGGRGRGRRAGWGGRGGTPLGRQGICLTAGPSVGEIRTVTGTVASLEASGQRAALVLDTAGGKLELMVAPYRALADAGVVLSKGDTVKLTWATVSTPRGSFDVVFTVTDPATGKTIQLRDPATGRPSGTGRGNGRRGMVS